MALYCLNLNTMYFTYSNMFVHSPLVLILHCKNAKGVIHKPRGQNFDYFCPPLLPSWSLLQNKIYQNGHLATPLPTQRFTWFMDDPELHFIKNVAYLFLNPIQNMALK